MKHIKLFEQIEDDDPFGEETKKEDSEMPYDVIDEDDEDYSQNIGVCYNCGSISISYGNTNTYDESVGYPYHCATCGSDGEELYMLHFMSNSAAD